MPQQALTEVLVQPAAARTEDAEASGNQALRTQLRQLDARLDSFEHLEAACPAEPQRPRTLERRVSYLPGAPNLSRIPSGKVAAKSLVEPLLVSESTSSTYLVSNKLLKASTKGLGIRREKDLSQGSKNGEIIFWGKYVEGFDERDGWVGLKAGGYLPMVVDDKPVLVQAPRRQTGLATYKASNRLLLARTKGLGVRREKDLSECSKNGKTIFWDDTVEGLDEGDGWVRTKEGGYLPMMVNGAPVLVQAISGRGTYAVFPADDEIEAEAEHPHSCKAIALGGCFEGVCICTVLGFWIHGAMLAVQSSESDCGNAVTAFWVLLSSTLVLTTCCGLWGLTGSTRGVIVGCSMALTFAIVAAVFTWYTSLVPETCGTQLASAFQRLGIVHWCLAGVFVIGAIALHYIHIAHQAMPHKDDGALLQMAREAKKNQKAFPLVRVVTQLPNIAEVTERLKRDHALFWANVQLALVAAFWMSLCAAPICWTGVYSFLFGSEATVTVYGEEVPLCKPWTIGRYVNTAEPGHNPDLRVWQQGHDHEWNPDDPKMVDCGIMFRSYASCSPLVIQMIVYTIWHSTGSTVRLAWQGFAGMFVAVLNLYVMLAILPHGAKGHDCTEEEASYDLCDIGSIRYDDENYGSWGIWLCWFDVVFILFLFLISTAPQNLIKFGMWYHINFMMEFMDYTTGYLAGHHPTPIPGVQWDSPIILTLISVSLGCILSVVITYMPIPLLNITNLDRDALLVVHSIKDIWRLSIKYFCGNQQTEMDQRIKSRIRTLDEPFALFATNLNDSWWETINIGHFGSKRALYGVWIGYMQRFHTVLSTMQTTIETLHFGEHHRCFCNTPMQEAMMNLSNAVAETMEQCVRCCKNGHISEDEKDNLRKLLARVRKLQAEMLTKYNDIMESMRADQYAVRNLSRENMFCFTLSMWARRSMHFAEEVLSSDVAVTHSCWTLCCSCVNVFAFDQITDVEHLTFCFRNLISIMICFVLGYYLPAGLTGTVFTPCSPAMAGTLVLLLNSKPGAAVKKSIERLLSVTLGKVLPILAMSIVGICPQEHKVQPVVHMVLIFVYMFMFEYMHLTSTNWSAVGCNVAAFGATVLYSRITSFASVDFSMRYQEIAQVIIAVIVQFLVDCIFREKTGRQHAVKSVDMLKSKFRKCLVHDASSMTLTMKELHDQVEDLQQELLSAEQWIPEVDPSMQLVASWKTPFRHRLYASAVHSFRELRGDLRVMLLALADRPGDGEDGTILRRLNTYNKVFGEFVQMFDNVMRLLQLILAQEDDRPITDPCALAMETWQRDADLDGLDDLIREINQLIPSCQDKNASPMVLCDDARVRFAVLVRSLQNGRAHLMALLTNCLQENIYED